MDGWYYKLFDSEFGPVKFDDLIELAKNHTLSRDDEVRFGEDGVWRRAGSIGTLMAHIPFEAGNHVITKSAAQEGSDNSFGGTAVAEPLSMASWSGEDLMEPAGPPPEIDNRWWCKIHGNDFGPLSFDELVDMAKVETLSRDDEVRLGQAGLWRRAGSIGSLMAHFPFQAGKHVVSQGGPRDSLDRRSAVMSPAPAAPYPQAPGYSPPDAYASPQAYAAPQGYAAPQAYAPADPYAAPQAYAPAPGYAPAGAAMPAPIAVPQPQPPVADEPPAPTTGLPWWCIIEDKEYGPIEYDKVIEWVESGRLHADDHVRNGRNAYILAKDVPGLFPERPTSVKSGTNPNVSAMSNTQSLPVSGKKKLTSEQKIEAWLSAKVPTKEPEPKPETEPVSQPAPAPMNNSSASMSTGGYGGGGGGYGGGGGFGGGSMASNRPMAAPVRRPPAKSSSGGGGNIMELLTGPIGMGVGGTIVAVALIYFALPYLPLGDSSDVKKFKELRDAVMQVVQKRADDNVKPDQLKPLGENMDKVAKSVATELKGSKTPAHKKILSLATKMQAMAKENLAKPGDAEKAVHTAIASAAKELKVKD